MQDFFVEQDQIDGTFDIVIESRQYKTTDTFDTAIYYQLFVNKRSTKNEISTPRKRGGWMGDLATKPNYESGSFLYTKAQARNTQTNKNEIAEYCKLALKYFRKFGAKKITAEVVGDDIVGEITVDNDRTILYSALWGIK